MKTILVTGRNGFLGMALVESLKKEYRIISLVRKLKDSIDYSNEEVIVIDSRLVKNGDINKYNIELIVHLAASIRGRKKELYENNVQASEAIFKIADSFNIPVIYLSSTNVLFSDQLGAYALSKKKGEELLISSRLNYLILRIPLVIGRDSSSMKKVINFYKKFRFFPLFGLGQGKVQPIHVSSVVNKIFDKIREGISSREVLNIVGNKSYSYKDIITNLLNIDKNPRFIKIPFLLSKFIIGAIEKANVSFSVSLEELNSINMDKIVKSNVAGKTEYLDNNSRALFA